MILLAHVQNQSVERMPESRTEEIIEWYEHKLPKQKKKQQQQDWRKEKNKKIWYEYVKKIINEMIKNIFSNNKANPSNHNNSIENL